MALEWYIKNVMKDDEEWEVESYIIALDKYTNEVRVFGFNERDLMHHVTDIHFYMDRLYWHLKHDLWEHRYEYYNNNGIETL